jgi:ABC-type dipeptide/oligopeptide/nickel transport system permease subunit
MVAIDNVPSTMPRALAVTRSGSESEWFRVWRRLRRNRPALVGLAIVGVVALLSVFPEVVAPYSPYTVTSSLRGSGPSAAHPFGMDQVGRDVLSRVIYGARVAMLVGLAATGLSLLVGVLVGATAGYFGGIVDVVLMRLVDALQAFPILVLLIAIAAALGPSLEHVIVILGLTTWAQYARVVRADVLSLREREFVLAARTLGVPSARHILPNALGPIIVLASLSVAGVILLESALSFLGLGTQPPTASWGSMLADGRTYILTYPHIALFPGLAITLAVLAFNLLGDGLRDALDPRTRT